MIDVHVLTHEGTRKDWLDQCMASLEGHPISIHLIDNRGRSVGEGRARGYAMGRFPLVAYVDSDDYVLPGCFDACLEAIADKHAVVTMELIEYLDGSRYPFAMPGHNLSVYQRKDVLPWLGAMGASPHTTDARMRGIIKPAQIQTVGYVWRVHQDGDHHKTTPEAFKKEGASWHIQTVQR